MGDRDRLTMYITLDERKMLMLRLPIEAKQASQGSGSSGFARPRQGQILGGRDRAVNGRADQHRESQLLGSLALTIAEISTERIQPFEFMKPRKESC
jgi:hypothetical protein